MLDNSMLSKLKGAGGPGADIQ